MIFDQCIFSADVVHTTFSKIVMCSFYCIVKKKKLAAELQRIEDEPLTEFRS